MPVIVSPWTSSRGWFRWLYTIVAGLMPSGSRAFGLSNPQEHLEKLRWDSVLGNLGNANVRTDVRNIQAALAMQNPAELKLIERLQNASN